MAENKFVFHVLGMPFTATGQRFLADAHTQNIYLMCRLLSEQGHTVIHYGNFGSDPVCTENVEILDRETMDRLYAENNVKNSPNGFFCKQTPEIDQAFVRKAVEEIGKRKSADQFLLGLRDPHEEIYRHHKDMMYVHHSVGHVGWSPKSTVYASEYVRNFRFSKEHSRTKEATAWHSSAVIPHFLMASDFDPCYEADDYFLYLGRLSSDKGVQIALDATEKLKTKLYLAGSGDFSQFRSGGNAEYLGFIEDQQARNTLLRKAKALFVPTQIPEAFGMVVIEAMMCGVPVITSDWGAFPETVQHGVTGFRCTTLHEYVEAAKSIGSISRETCRAVALQKYSFESASRLYQNYFERIYDLKKNGFNSLARTVVDLNSLSHP